MLRADAIVLLDTAQYSRQSFQNRMRIRNPDGSQWLTVPVKGGQFGDSIAETVVDGSSGWQRLHDKALRFNYSTSPFYEHYRPRLEPVFHESSQMLGDITCRSMVVLSELFGSGVSIDRASGLPGSPRTISAILGRYPDGVLLQSHSTSGVEADVPRQVICTVSNEPWRQNFDGFVSGMSSLDLLFNLGPEARSYLLANSRLQS